MKRLTKVFCFAVISIFLSVMFLNIKINAEGNKEDKVIYLTFDDGPSYIITDRILDILKEKEVRAIFFVVGSKVSGKEQILKRIHSEGHAIGLHTYTHKYEKIYKSNDIFIKGMEDTSDEINRVLGYKPNAIRFPGGSKPFLNESFLEKLHEKNYKIYDWNASLSDGLNYNTSTDKLVREAHKIVGKSHSKIFLLLHCDQTNGTTAKALPRIIDYYKNLGYQFKAITEDTPEYYFRFKQ